MKDEGKDKGRKETKIRPLVVGDEPFLWQMLYHALYVPAGQVPFAPEIVYQPELALYVEQWGQVGDGGFLAAVAHQPVGAVWVRLFTSTRPGYGFVNDQTPELSMAILPTYRGQGLGTQLLEKMLEQAHQVGFPAVSLSVSAGNPAQRLYTRLGFEVVQQSDDSYTMFKQFST